MKKRGEGEEGRTSARALSLACPVEVARKAREEERGQAKKKSQVEVFLERARGCRRAKRRRIKRALPPFALSL